MGAIQSQPNTLPMLSENLRREARVDACIPVIVVRGRGTVAFETSDISFKGLFLRTTDPPAVRSLMRLRIALPVREIEVHGMAVHVSATTDESEVRLAGVGVQFWGLAGPDRIAWDDFVRDLIKEKRDLMRRAAAPRSETELNGVSIASGVMPIMPNDQRRR